MIYTISIDWLAVYCHYMPTPVNSDGEDGDPIEWTPIDTQVGADGGDMFGAYVWRYKIEVYGTRQFSRLVRVSIPNEVHGWDDFAEVQATPHSGILTRNSIIVRFVNRALYRTDFWELATHFLEENKFVFKSISRIDICADFNQFHAMSPMELIEGFAAKKYRHIGRGVGALYFDHGVIVDRYTGTREYGVRYTGLSFGVHSSDMRVYLYNKSFELLTQGDKPWIKDTWRAVGLDIKNVWRLEVSLKAEGCKFRDKITGKHVTIDIDNSANENELSKIYHSFVLKKFAFVKNHHGITNISREPRIKLFDLHPIYAHASLRNVSPGNRFERMFLKALYQLGDLYRGNDPHDDAMLAQSLAYDIAANTDLDKWLAEKIPTWEKPTHK